MMNNESGAIAILTAIMLTMFLGFAALSIDTGHLMVTKNELQNAADAGALAGARELYNSDGSVIQTSCNQIAKETAIKNYSEKFPVEVIWENGNGPDVERGHWSFGTGTFTANASTELTDLWNVSTIDLDGDTDFINAVRVKTRREDITIKSFFAKILGYDSFQQTATAVAYLGFAGTILPNELDLPLAICLDSILVDGKYSCNIGRVINNGNDATTSETGRWTNFSSAPPDGTNLCANITDSTSNDDFKYMFDECGDWGMNPEGIDGGDSVSTNNGAMTVLSKIYDCFVAKHNKTTPETPWSVNLPVIDCTSGPGCGRLVGSVNVIILWVTNAKDYSEAPTEMDGMETDDYSYDEWGAPTDGTTVADGGNEGNLYDFMKTLDDYNGVEDWNKELEKEFGLDWRTMPLADFFDVEGMSIGEAKAAGKVRWASFIQHFNLKNVTIDGTAKPAPFAKESIYFLPDCTRHETKGVTGGENTGVLAKIPVLVD